MFVTGQNNKSLWSILANGDKKSIEITPIDKEDPNNNGIKISSSCQGFTRLGLRADFRAWLQELGAVQGNYGLEIAITGIKETTAEKFNSATSTYKVRLDTSDMYGNPYNFEGYYSQEIVIDISALARVDKIQVFLYQDDNFYDKDNKKIPIQLTEGVTGITSILPNNIFVKNIYFSFGIGLDEINGEFLKLYTNDGLNYKVINGQVSKKSIHLKWIHFDDDNNKSQISRLPAGAEILWYRYDFGAPSADERCGVYWTFVDNTNQFNYEFTPRTEKQDERYKVIIRYNNKYYYSNIITFRNDMLVPNDATVDVLNALSIHCVDSTNGNYLIYDQANYLLNTVDNKIVRSMQLYFNSKTYRTENNSEDESQLTEAQEVLWLLPKNSMMSFALEGQTLTDYDNNYYQIKSNNPNDKDFIVKYKVNNFYSANKSNNTVIAKIKRDNVEYTAKKEFTFGQAGTNGTDCTLVIDLVDDQVGNPIVAITSGEIKDYKFRASLYDNTGKEIDLSGYNCIWSLNVDDSDVSLKTIAGKSNEITFAVLNKNSLMNKMYILSVTLQNWGNYLLTAYYPIPITSGQGSYINGPTQVIYLSDGEAVFSKEPYQLYGNDEQLTQIQNVYWDIYPASNGYQYTECYPTVEDLKYKTYYYKSKNSDNEDVYIPTSLSSNNIKFNLVINPKKGKKYYLEDKITEVIYTGEKQTYYRLNSNKDKYTLVNSYWDLINNETYYNADGTQSNTFKYQNLYKKITNGYTRDDNGKYLFVSATLNDNDYPSFYLPIDNTQFYQDNENVKYTLVSPNALVDKTLYFQLNEVTGKYVSSYYVEQPFYQLSAYKSMVSQVDLIDKFPYYSHYDTSKEDYTSVEGIYLDTIYDKSSKINNLSISDIQKIPNKRYIIKNTTRGSSTVYNQVAIVSYNRLINNLFDSDGNKITSIDDLNINQEYRFLASGTQFNYRVVYPFEFEELYVKKYELINKNGWKYNTNYYIFKEDTMSVYEFKEYYISEINGNNIVEIDFDNLIPSKLYYFKQNNNIYKFIYTGKALYSLDPSKDTYNIIFNGEDIDYNNCYTRVGTNNNYVYSVFNKLNYYKKIVGTDIVNNPVNGEKYYIKDSDGNLIVTTYRTINYYEKIYNNTMPFGTQYYKKISQNESDFYGIIKIINNKSYLYPLAIYVNSAPQYAVQCKNAQGNILWTQPILVLQNKYPSSMINKWDGKSLVLNEASGSILASQIAAGKKNDDNTFSGVLMGDWSPNGESISDNSISGQTGVYGFHQGEQSFALKEDGTAFFGKDGKGRIILDGNECLLKSATYDISNGNGMLINLEKNLLDCKVHGNSIFTINSGIDSINYLTIKDPDSQNILMNVSNSNYYLQSQNYLNNNQEGMKIDLSNGYIWANTGIFNGDIYIRYSGNGNASSDSLNSILEQLRQAVDDAAAAIDKVSDQVDAIETAQARADAAWSRAEAALDEALVKLDKMSSGNGGIDYGYEGSSGLNGTQGIQMWAFGENGDSYYGGGYVAASDKGASLYFSNSSQIYVVSSGCYSGSAMQIMSDRRLKTDINYNHINTYKQLFNELKPVSYKYKDLDKIYLGFIAQDVENSLQKNNINDKSLVNYNNEHFLSLDYNSLFTLNIAVTQDLMKEIEELKLQVKELKEEKTNE